MELLEGGEYFSRQLSKIVKDLYGHYTLALFGDVVDVDALVRWYIQVKREIQPTAAAIGNDTPAFQRDLPPLMFNLPLNQIAISNHKSGRNIIECWLLLAQLSSVWFGAPIEGVFNLC